MVQPDLGHAFAGCSGRDTAHYSSSSSLAQAEQALRIARDLVAAADGITADPGGGGGGPSPSPPAPAVPVPTGSPTGAAARTARRWARAPSRAVSSTSHTTASAHHPSATPPRHHTAEGSLSRPGPVRKFPANSGQNGWEQGAPTATGTATRPPRTRPRRPGHRAGGQAPRPAPTKAAVKCTNSPNPAPREPVGRSPGAVGVPDRRQHRDGSADSNPAGGPQECSGGSRRPRRRAATVARSGTSPTSQPGGDRQYRAGQCEPLGGGRSARFHTPALKVQRPRRQRPPGAPPTAGAVTAADSHRRPPRYGRLPGTAGSPVRPVSPYGVVSPVRPSPRNGRSPRNGCPSVGRRRRWAAASCWAAAVLRGPSDDFLAGVLRGHLDDVAAGVELLGSTRSLPRQYPPRRGTPPERPRPPAPTGLCRTPWRRLPRPGPAQPSPPQLSDPVGGAVSVARGWWPAPRHRRPPATGHLPGGRGRPGPDRERFVDPRSAPSQRVATARSPSAGCPC